MSAGWDMNPASLAPWSISSALDPRKFKSHQQSFPQMKLFENNFFAWLGLCAITCNDMRTIFLSCCFSPSFFAFREWRHFKASCELP